MRLRVIINKWSTKMRALPTLSWLTLSLLFVAPGSIAHAQQPPEIALTFSGAAFEPSEVPVPAGAKFTLRIDNKSAAAMEWESHALNREKVVAAGKSGKLSIGPLSAGSYEFFDDFHPKIRGHLIAR